MVNSLVIIQHLLLHTYIIILKKLIVQLILAKMILHRAEEVDKIFRLAPIVLQFSHRRRQRSSFSQSLKMS